jgi:hypothetical protein
MVIPIYLLQYLQSTSIFHKHTLIDVQMQQMDYFTRDI